MAPEGNSKLDIHGLAHALHNRDNPRLWLASQLCALDPPRMSKSKRHGVRTQNYMQICCGAETHRNFTAATYTRLVNRTKQRDHTHARCERGYVSLLDRSCAAPTRVNQTADQQQRRKNRNAINPFTKARFAFDFVNCDP